MAKQAMPDEVHVVRFFETGPIQKVEAVFNIVSQKMRERLRGKDEGSEGSLGQSGSTRKRRSRHSTEMPVAEPSGQTV